MTTMYLICDESGAKGYSDKEEKYLGEIGVMAGFAFSEKDLNEIRSDLGKIASPFFAEGKLHITDLSADDQVLLRNRLFNYLKERNIICLYEAIYSEGFYKQYEIINDFKNQARDQCRSGIKVSNNPTKELLQEAKKNP